MYAWEKSFNNMVSFTRLSEVKLIKYSSYLRGIYLCLMVFTERTTLFITLITYVSMRNTMTAHITFALAGYFNILQLLGVIFFPQALIMCGEAVISIKRIQVIFRYYLYFIINTQWFLYFFSRIFCCSMRY